MSQVEDAEIAPGIDGHEIRLAEHAFLDTECLHIEGKGSAIITYVEQRRTEVVQPLRIDRVVHAQAAPPDLDHLTVEGERRSAWPSPAQASASLLRLAA